MTDATANLQLPFLAAAQAQKHVTVNSALQRLDLTVQMTARSASTTAQPADPVDGSAYILPPGKTGAAWGAMANGAVAYWRDGAWEQVSPKAGWIAYVVDADAWRLFDGAAWRDPFAGLGPIGGAGPIHLVFAGQSNMVGAGGARGDMAIPANVEVWAGGAWVAPVFGTAPASTDNNLWVHCAGAVAARTGRLVRCIVNAMSGKSIVDWDDDQSMWTDLTAQIAASGAPRIDGMIWWQGEADSTTAQTLSPGTPNTAALYLSRLDALVARLRALPQWRSGTPFGAFELGGWFDNASSARNDAIRQLNGRDDALVGAISTHGTERSPDPGDEAHVDGAFMPSLGRRAADFLLGAWAGGRRPGAGLRLSNNRPIGEALDLGQIDDQTISLGEDDLRGLTTIATKNTTISLPLASRVPGASLLVNVWSISGGNTIVTCAQTIDFQGASATSATLATPGMHRFTAIRGRWRQEIDPALNGPLRLKTYAKAALPAASPAGQLIYVTDEAGGATPAFSDGSSWRRVVDRAVVA